jgi:alkylation response protein AidB-like acyl-CoA dehydrogenase
VDLELSDDQRIVQSTARQFLERRAPIAQVRASIEKGDDVDRDLWSQAGELGWFAAFVAEADGGGSVSGAPVADTAIVAEEAGRAVLSGPLIATNVVADAIARQGDADQRDAHLGGLVDGSTVATWAFAERSGRWDPDGVELAATPTPDGWALSGVKAVVPSAAAADLLLVTARHDGTLVQFLVPRDTAGLSVTPLDSLDVARHFADVRFDDVHLPDAARLGDDATQAVARQLDLATVLVCAESVGAADRCFEITLEYAKERTAFGRPIGSFQALKHRFADMLLWLEGMKAITDAAVVAVDRDVDRAQAVSIAKAYVSERGPMIVRDCLQIHGGIGYTWEHDLHLYLRRVESNALLFGGVDHHRDRVASIVGLGGQAR